MLLNIWKRHFFTFFLLAALTKSLFSTLSTVCHTLYSPTISPCFRHLPPYSIDKNLLREQNRAFSPSGFFGSSPYKNSQYFRKNCRYFRKNSQYFCFFCPYFCSCDLIPADFSCNNEEGLKGLTGNNSWRLHATCSETLRSQPASLCCQKKSGMTSRSRAHHAASFVKSIQLLGIPTSGNRAQGASTEHCAPPGRLAALIFSGIRTSDTLRFHPGRFRTRDSGQSDCASQILPKQH